MVPRVPLGQVKHGNRSFVMKKERRRLTGSSSVSIDKAAG